MKSTSRTGGAETGRPSRALSLRPKEAAEVLGISERLLWEWTRAEGVPHVRIGNVILYPVDGVRQWLAERSIARTDRQGGPT